MSSLTDMSLDGAPQYFVVTCDAIFISDVLLIYGFAWLQDCQISAGWAAGWVFAALCWQLCESTKLLASLSASVWNCMTVVISAIYLICHLTAGDETALLLWHDSVFSNEEYSEVRDSFLFCFFTCEMKSFMSLSPYLWNAHYDVVVLL